jgi:hypothetical protein
VGFHEDKRSIIESTGVARNHVLREAVFRDVILAKKFLGSSIGIRATFLKG